MIECPNCEKTSSGLSCRLCGWSPAPSAVPKAVPETQRAWIAPSYPAPEPGDDALIRAEMARARKLLGMAEGASQGAREPALQPTARLKLAIDPAIRAEVARRASSSPEPVGAVVGRVLKRR